MKGVGLLIAVITQLMCLIGVSAEFGLEAGVYVLCAIIANAVQCVLSDKNKEE